MSKYDPLKRYLEGRDTEQTPMTFAEVERVLGFPLPNSARTNSSWWSNNPGTHVGVAAWRDAGWKATRADIGSERVVFVRQRREVSPAPEQPDTSLRVDLDRLSAVGRRLVEDYAAEARGDMVAAVTRAVHEAGVARRARLVDEWVARAPRMPPGAPDAVELIREDRDSR